MVKRLPTMWEPRFNAWVGKISQKKECQPTAVFFPGQSRGQRKLADYSPWGHKGWGMTERLSLSRSNVNSFLGYGISVSTNLGSFFKKTDFET